LRNELDFSQQQSKNPDCCCFFWTLEIPYSGEVPNNKTLSVFITFLLSRQTWEMSSIFLNNNLKWKNPDCCWFFFRTLEILTGREGPNRFIIYANLRDGFDFSQQQSRNPDCCCCFFSSWRYARCWWHL